MILIVQVLLVRWQAWQRTSGHLHRQELRQVRHRRPRARPRRRVLARTHQVSQQQVLQLPEMIIF